MDLAEHWVDGAIIIIIAEVVAPVVQVAQSQC
jgi:hypothetical protein